MTSEDKRKLFIEGYEHGLISNKLTDFRQSFRMGFRKAKLEHQGARNKQGIYSLPLRLSFKNEKS